MWPKSLQPTPGSAFGLSRTLTTSHVHRPGVLSLGLGRPMRTKYDIRIMLALALAMSSCSRPTTPSTGDFDLEAASLAYKPNPVRVGDKVVFNYTVRNNGTNTVLGRTYQVDLYLNARLISFDHGTSDLLPGRTTSYGSSGGHFHWQPTNAARYHYRFVVDEQNTVRERIETNNVLEGDIDVVQNQANEERPNNPAAEQRRSSVLVRFDCHWPGVAEL